MFRVSMWSSGGPRIISMHSYKYIRIGLSCVDYDEGDDDDVGDASDDNGDDIV